MKFLFSLISMLMCTGLLAFDATWYDMQQHYRQLCSINSTIPTQELHHPQWQQYTEQIRSMILGTPQPRFLHHQAIGGSMVRSGMQTPQHFEISYINECARPSTRVQLQSYQEPAIGNLAKECREFNCSSNALGQLYYAARVLDALPEEPPANMTLVEFGGGFGALAHIMKSVLPTSTYIIIDLPELIALQYLFLRSSIQEADIIVVDSADNFQIAPGSVTLIPATLLDEIDLQADIFISNFALSEAPAAIQKRIIDRNFYDAKLCYITGQLNGWHDFGFIAHQQIHNAIRSQYGQVICQPFHLFLAALQSYEIIAQ